MSCKTILTVVTSPDPTQTALDAAIAFAASGDGHLDVLCIGIDRSQASFPVAGMGIGGDIFDAGRALAEEDRDAIEAAVRPVLEAAGGSWSLESHVVPVPALSTVVGARARYADLVVLPRPYGEDVPADAPIALEAAMFQGRAPVMVLPRGRAVPDSPARVMVAWNESPEALTAVRAALPFLQAAAEVDVVIVDPARHAVGTADPGADLARMLARHGVSVSVDTVARTLPRVSDTILREISDRGADMVVIGAYSHSRFREAILGGTTRNLLEMAEVPVLMAH